MPLPLKAGCFARRRPNPPKSEPIHPRKSLREGLSQAFRAVTLGSLVVLGVCLSVLGSAVPVKANPWNGSVESTGYSDEQALTCLALTIYFEARGEPRDGKLAVGHVVVNRSADDSFPDRICDVVQQGGAEKRYACQFSWWCDGLSDAPAEQAAWQESIALAKEILSDSTPDPTQGALWYHADMVSPSWSQKLKRGPIIGRHVFYLDVRHPPLHTLRQLARDTGQDL